MNNSPPRAVEFLTPASLISAAKRAHPAFKFAVVVAGLASLVAVVAKFGVSLATIVFGIITLVVLMVLFLVFAQAAVVSKARMALPAMVLVWSFLVLTIVVALFLATSAFFDFPLRFKTWIERQLKVAVAQQPGTTDVGSQEVAISAITFGDSETFPRMLIEVRKGESNARVTSLKFRVVEVWQTTTMWSPTSVPANWGYDVLLPVLGAPYDRTIPIDQPLTDELTTIPILLGSDAPPAEKEFIYDIEVQLILEGSSIRPTERVMFVGQSAAKWITGVHRGDVDKLFDRNTWVADQIKSHDRIQCPRVAHFIENYSDVGVPRLVKMLSDQIGEIRRRSAINLGRLGPSAREALPELRTVYANDQEYLVREAAGTAIERINSRKAVTKQFAIPDPVGLSKEMEAWKKPPEFLREILSYEPSEVPSNYDDFTEADWHSKGYDEWRRGDYRAAVESLTRSIEMGGDDYFTRGYCYLELGAYQKAVEDLTKASQKFGGYSWTFNNRGNAYLRLGKVGEALADYNRAIKLSPKEAKHYRNRAYLHVQYGYRQDGVSDMVRAVELEPLKSTYHLELAEIQLIAGKYEDVIGLPLRIESIADESDLTVAFLYDSIARVLIDKDSTQSDNSLMRLAKRAGTGGWNLDVLDNWVKELDDRTRQKVEDRVKVFRDASSEQTQ
jgi:tetratricopeptide (TPR) repeat protein